MSKQKEQEWQQPVTLDTLTKPPTRYPVTEHVIVGLGRVWVREMTVRERLEGMPSTNGDGPPDGADTMRAVLRKSLPTLCTPNGLPLITSEADLASAIDGMMERGFSIVNGFAEIHADINRIGDAAVEEAEGNSDATPDDDSSSS